MLPTHIEVTLEFAKRMLRLCTLFSSSSPQYLAFLREWLCEHFLHSFYYHNLLYKQNITIFDYSRVRWGSKTLSLLEGSCFDCIDLRQFATFDAFSVIPVNFRVQSSSKMPSLVANPPVYLFVLHWNSLQIFHYFLWM